MMDDNRPSQSYTAVHQVTEEELPQYIEHVISDFKLRAHAVCMPLLPHVRIATGSYGLTIYLSIRIAL